MKEAGTKFPSSDCRRSLALCLHAFTHLPTIKPTSTRRGEFVDGNHQRAHSVNGPTRRVGEATGREPAVSAKRRAGSWLRHFCGAFPITLSHSRSTLG